MDNPIFLVSMLGPHTQHPQNTECLSLSHPRFSYWDKDVSKSSLFGRSWNIYRGEGKWNREGRPSIKGMLPGQLPWWEIETNPTGELWKPASHTWELSHPRNEGAAGFRHQLLLLLRTAPRVLLAYSAQWQRSPLGKRCRCWLLETRLTCTKVRRVTGHGQGTNNIRDFQRLTRLNYIVLEVLKSLENVSIPPGL